MEVAERSIEPEKLQMRQDIWEIVSVQQGQHRGSDRPAGSGLTTSGGPSCPLIRLLAIYILRAAESAPGSVRKDDGASAQSPCGDFAPVFCRYLPYGTTIVGRELERQG